MVGLTLDLASELAPHNIHVNVIMPGAIRAASFPSPGANIRNGEGAPGGAPSQTDSLW